MLDARIFRCVVELGGWLARDWISVEFKLMLAPHINPEAVWGSGRGWGTIDCPYCPARGVDKVSRNQITCGSPACRNKQGVKAARLAREKKRRIGK